MLQISGVTKRYDDETGMKHVALDHVDLAVDEHEAVVLVGSSGCGKTTLLRILRHRTGDHRRPDPEG